MKVFSGVLIGSSGNFDEEDGTIFEDENFRFLKRSGKNIHNEDYSEYEVVTIEGSAADKQVVDIKVEKSVGLFTSSSKPGSGRIYISVGTPMNINRSIPQLVSVLEDAMDFARKVADYLGIPKVIGVDE